MPDYRDTLQLPATDFAMKANLSQSEPKTQQRYEASRLYERLDAARASAPIYRFHDGPPYANGPIHVGHMLNKVLKDLVVRTRLMEGMRCPYTPGWDCHGLPIEHRVMTELSKKGKMKELDALPADQRRMAIRRACGGDAGKFIQTQADGMKRLLTLADYAQPYRTMDPAYEGATLELFASLVEQGIVFRERKPVHWSIANRTALAEAELEYEEREDPSIWVDFEVADREAVGKAFGIELDATPSLMIWTTTPWTLPANLAIAVGGRYNYALVRIDGSETIIASDLLEKVSKAIGAEHVERLAETTGDRLVGLEYRHPFCERTGKVIAADHVTLEDGTGLVHTAPGHGEEDWRAGRKEGLDAYCPVRDNGTYDDTVPEWLRGVSIWEANKSILEHLTKSGHLVHHVMFKHSYPHDWRSKTPVIFRATEQWFIGVDRKAKNSGRTIRELASEAVESKIEFVPEWGRNRLRGMVDSRPDWCLSRQRSWGLPIPAFQLEDGSLFMTPASIRAVAKAIRQHGSDAWFTLAPQELLAHYDPSKDPEAPKALKVAALAKLFDIFDVWFEAGSSWHSVLEERGLGFPAELYLEGSDQHRGWFQLSLLLALAARGQPPFRRLVTHGFVVDKDGKKMSKSLGNTIEVEAIVKEFGADVCRWWVSGIAYEGDVRMDLEHLRTAGEAYRKIRNTVRFLLSNLGDLPADTEWRTQLKQVEPESIDGWALGETSRLEREVRDAYQRFDFRAAHLALFAFCNDAMSSSYCVAVKDRLYCDRPDSPRRRRSQVVMRACAEVLCRLLAPILPHTADEIYRTLHPGDATVHEQTHLGLSFQAHAGWSQAMEARSAALKALEEAKARGVENAMDAGLVVPDREGTLGRFAADFADLCGVSRARFDPKAAAVEVIDLRDAPRCERSRRRDESVALRSDGGMLSDRDFDAVTAYKTLNPV
ncbi:MAG: isoleucine--tRNA ligase [Planctomycetes bacterium]|nr:isoleucine--tRNA ligase [Planctomycetota bacterium]